MLVFNCTKAAADFLSPRKSKDTAPLIQPAPKFGIDEIGTAKSPISQWLIQHSVELDRDILYVCHVQHRFTMVFTEVEQGDWLSFMQSFWERLVNHLCWLVEDMELDLHTTPQDWLNNIRKAHSNNSCSNKDKPLFCKRYNPSVGASVTRFRTRFEQALYEIGCLPDNEGAGTFEVDENACIQFSNSKGGEFFPANEFFCDCLEMYLDVSQKELPAFKEKSLQYFEKNFNDLLNLHSPYSNEVLEMVNALIAEDKVKQAMKGKTKQKKQPDNVVELKSKR